MVFLKHELSWCRLVVFVLLLVFRTTVQKIASRAVPVGNQVDIYTSPYVDTAFCRTIPGLTKYQIELCNQQPDTTMKTLEGLNQAVKECQSQFDGNRWNCSSLSTRAKNPYVSAILQKGYKETAFSYAISAAGVVVAVARACSKSELQNCGCDGKIYKMRKPRPPHTIPEELAKNQLDTLQNVLYQDTTKDKSVPWKWGGCSDNLKYGIRFSKMFLDSRETADDIRSKTNLHNNQVGRMAVKHNMQMKCKCHGVSGSCQMRTCFRAIPDLKVVGHILKDKFKSAILVDQSNLGSKSLRKFNIANPKLTAPRGDKPWTARKHKKKRDLSFELLYYEKSPNFCDRNPSLDVPGTAGRLCNSTARTGAGSCTSLCCGRGYNSVKRSRKERCRCKFVWCCEVKCDVCDVTNWISVCK